MPSEEEIWAGGGFGFSRGGGSGGAGLATSNPSGSSQATAETIRDLPMEMENTIYRAHYCNMVRNQADSEPEP